MRTGCTTQDTVVCGDLASRVGRDQGQKDLQRSSAECSSLTAPWGARSGLLCLDGHAV